jgi:valyl-tRNA synthetase
MASVLKPYFMTIQTLTQVKPLQLVDTHHSGTSDNRELVLVLKDSEVVIPLASMLDLTAEKIRLQKEYAEVKANKERLEARLGDAAFINKAPAGVVKKERDRLVESQDKLQRLKQQLDRFD